MAAEDSESSDSSMRKRPLSDPTAGGSPKKQRGRPRVQKKDETAADRRRTQIRLAQRAYRSRKETTIASLKSNTTELENIIEQMNSSVLSLKKSVLDFGLSNLDPTVITAFKTTFQDFAALSQKAKKISAEQAEVVEQVQKAKPSLTQEPNQQLIIQQTSKWMENFPASSPTKSDADNLYRSVWGYQIEYDASEGEEQNVAINSAPNLSNVNILSKNQLAVVDGLYNSVADMKLPPSPVMDIFPFNYSSPEPLNLPLSPPLELPAPFTYSFQETTFARRLHRASLEAAYHALTQDKVNPKRLARALRLSFLFDSKRSIAEKIKEILRRSTTEPLEFTGSAFLQIGGAGTHYPHTDQFGNIIKARNTYESISNDDAEQALFPGFSLALLDLEGEFFDPQDVEGYLRERGLWINPQDSFAEGDLVDIEPNSPNIVEEPESDCQEPDLVSSPSYFSGSSSNSLFRTPTPDPIPLDPLTNLDSTYGAISSGNFGLPSPQASWLPMPPRESRSSKHVVVDVQKLIDGIIKRAVCLGRSPGYRRNDINEALSRAIVGF